MSFYNFTYTFYSCFMLVLNVYIATRAYIALYYNMLVF